MKALTRSYLRSRFKEYYLQVSLEPPTDLQSREWGFLYFDQGGMRRHKAFYDRGELVLYIRSTVPAHVYFSSAYYRRPSAPTMREKEWLGADLIFDLDADHLRDVPKSFKDMLDQVKIETSKLLSFLTEDFGFQHDRIKVVFSGGRGYHIHVRDDRILGLQSDARREILDYLTGRGLQKEAFMVRRVVTGDSGREKALALRCPAADSVGWGWRINRAIVAFVEDLRKRDPSSGIEFLSSLEGMGEKKAETFYSYITDDKVLDQIRKGNLDGMSGISGCWSALNKYLAGVSVQIEIGRYMAGERGETDEPVTADVKRLIRFPGSLHGGTGMRVTPLSIDDLSVFNPLKDAVVFGDEPVAVEVTKDFQFEMASNRYRLLPGKNELPMHAAVFLMGKGAAELDR